jgi:group I intron endonuclease
MGWIYQIKNIVNDKVYIGQTSKHNVAARWMDHIKSINSGIDSHLIRAFKFHGLENFAFSVVAEVPDDHLDEAEIDAISNKNSLSPNGYNIREGGSRGKHSQESIEKIRESHIGKTHTDETKEKLRHLNLGKKHTQESKEKTRRAMLGKPKTKEAIEKAAKARTGLKRSDEIKEKMSLSRQIEVEQWSLDGSYINTYPSIKKACIETGCNDISKCCRGKYKQSGGFIWKYKDERSSKINAQNCDTQSSS